jgi:hypothetical protein
VDIIFVGKRVCEARATITPHLIKMGEKIKEILAATLLFLGR